MSTRRQRRSPKWQKRKTSCGIDHGREPSATTETCSVWVDGRHYAYDPQHPESLVDAVNADGVFTARIDRGGVVISAADLEDCEVTIIPEPGRVMPHKGLNRAQRRAREV